MFGSRNLMMTSPGVLPSVAYVSGDGHTTTSNSWTHDVLSGVTNGYFVVFYISYGTVSPTVTVDGTSMTLLAGYYQWSDGGSQTFAVFGLPLSSVAAGAYSFVMSNTYSEMSAQSFLYKNVGSATASGSFVRNGAWSQTVNPTPRGTVIHGAGSRVAITMSYDSGASLWTQGEARNRLYVQSTTVNPTTFSSEGTTRGTGWAGVSLKGVGE